jgi:hypothetical protein
VFISVHLWFLLLSGFRIYDKGVRYQTFRCHLREP